MLTNDALDHYGAVGPWLVRLEANNVFTRNLFTQIPNRETGWHLWGKNAGIFLQSDKGFEAVWKHVRKMVRVQNSKQDWFLFRFWDPQAASGFWPVFPDDHIEVARRYGIGVLSCVFWQEDDSFRIVQVEKPATALKRAPSLVETYEPFLKKTRWDRFCRRVCQSAKASPTLQDVSNTRFIELCERAKARGFRRERAIYDLVLAYAICASKGESIDVFHRTHLPAGRFPDDLTAAKNLLLKARNLPNLEIQHG
ncbi:hypothetical protein GQR58_029111 [Nymphon striatum]|nr:hypothetical protein GQR58_029111 [Nymphon striatum]